jgi:hypothetical protein
VTEDVLLIALTVVCAELARTSCWSFAGRAGLFRRLKGQAAIRVVPAS